PPPAPLRPRRALRARRRRGLRDRPRALLQLLAPSRRRRGANRRPGPAPRPAGRRVPRPPRDRRLGLRLGRERAGRRAPRAHLRERGAPAPPTPPLRRVPPVHRAEEVTGAGSEG